MELTREGVNWGPQRPCQCANMPVEAAPRQAGSSSSGYTPAALDSRTKASGLGSEVVHMYVLVAGAHRQAAQGDLAPAAAGSGILSVIDSDRGKSKSAGLRQSATA